MATYGYSTPYTGRGDFGPLPPGYMEAATAPGRNLAMGIAAMGQNIGQAIERYRTKKAETEAADMSRETLVGLYQQQLASDPKYIAIQQYTETGQLPPGVTEQDIPRYTQQVQADREMLNKFSDVLGDKFVDMSLAKKKAALGDAVMVLNQYRTNQQQERARELQDLQLAQARGQYETTQQLGQLMRYGLTMPTTQTVTEPTTEMLQPVGPVQPAVQPPAAATFNEPAYLKALEQYRQQAGGAPVDVESIKAQLAQLQPALSERPQQFRIPALQGGLGGGVGVSMATVTESPQQVAGRILDAQKKQQLLQAQLQRAQAPQPTMPTREQFTTQPTTQQPAAQFLQPVEVTGETTRTEAVPYEQLRKNIAQYAAQQGMRPEVFASLDRVLEIAGQRKPTTVEQVGDIGAVVKFGDKEQFVPRKDTNIDDLLKLQGVTINYPEFRGTAPSAKEAEAFREQYSNLLSSRRDIGRLLEIAKMGPAAQQNPTIKSEAEQLATAVQGAMRLEILGPGTVTEPDRQILRSMVPDPTRIFSLSSSNKKALEGLLSRATNGITTRAQSLGLQVMTPQAAPQRPGLASDPRVASIRARMSSGAITRQQAEQELRALK